MAFGWGGFLATVVQGYMQYKAAKEESEVQQKNAEFMKESADATRKKYAYEEDQRRRQTMRLISSQKAAAGSSGIKIGSFQPIYDETLSEGELDALAIRQQGSTEAGQYEAKANIYAKQAKATKKAGAWGAGETLLSGFGQAYS